MVIAPLSLRTDYWETFEVNNTDLEFLYNHLIEIESPQSSRELTTVLVAERIRQEKQALEAQQKAGGDLYFPKEHYEPGQALVFPALSWKKGKVEKVRPAFNPELPAFEVIDVKFEKGDQRQFAASLAEHRLNQPIDIQIDDKLLDPEYVLKTYGKKVTGLLDGKLKANPDLVQIGWRWFPRALLVDVNVGHLNLAEAVLDMAGGGPLPAKDLLEQIELPTDVNPKLTEFSLNLALQEDERFDEVGPSGEIIWFLRRLEPEAVREVPAYLRSHNHSYDASALTPDMLALETELDDELSQVSYDGPDLDEVKISLIYPHWRAGTLPLTARTKQVFPTAYESPRVKFTFVDEENGAKYPGWVVRPSFYVHGLRDWYEAQGLIPGSIIHLKKSEHPGEVLIKAEKHRSNREWIRTVLVGADGGIIFATLKQVVTAGFDERMAVAIPDVEALDQVWSNSSRQRAPLDQVVAEMMRELAKLNPQGHVHAQELYAAMNIVRRCPPGQLFSLIATRPGFIHVGDLYFRISESVQEEN